MFAWNQTRLMPPTWYGVGGSLVAFVEVRCISAGDDLNAPPPASAEAPLPPLGEPRWRLLHQMYREWPFFRALVGNLEMAIFKADLGVASRHAELVTDGALRERMWTEVTGEHARTLEAMARVTGRAALLADQPQLRETLRLRDPYIDPLSVLQAQMLSRYRALSPTAIRSGRRCWRQFSAASTGSRQACRIPADLGVAMESQEGTGMQSRAETIEGHDGHSFGSWLAVPDSGSGPGWSSSTRSLASPTDIKGVCERLAGLGYVALAPELYSRIEPTWYSTSAIPRTCSAPSGPCSASTFPSRRRRRPRGGFGAPPPRGGGARWPGRGHRLLPGGESPTWWPPPPIRDVGSSSTPSAIPGTVPGPPGDLPDPLPFR